MRRVRPDVEALVLDGPGLEMGRVDQIAEAQRHVALLPAADADELGLPSRLREERFEGELEIRVIPVGHVERDDRDRRRIGVEVIANQRPKRRLLRGLVLERATDELRKQLSELVDPIVHPSGP